MTSALCDSKISEVGTVALYSASRFYESHNAEGIFCTRIIEADDCYQYNSEKHTACNILMSPEFHHIIEQEIKLKDPILIYRKKTCHFDGHLQHQTAKRILAARRFGTGPISLSMYTKKWYTLTSFFLVFLFSSF